MARLYVMNPPLDAPEPVLLILTDINGYAHGMTTNAKTLGHSQTLGLFAG